MHNAEDPVQLINKPTVSSLLLFPELCFSHSLLISINRNFVFSVTLRTQARTLKSHPRHFSFFWFSTSNSSGSFWQLHIHRAFRIQPQSTVCSAPSWSLPASPFAWTRFVFPSLPPEISQHSSQNNHSEMCVYHVTSDSLVTFHLTQSKSQIFDQGLQESA